MAASPATPSPPAKPTATPTANNSARLENIICPAFIITTATECTAVLSRAGTRSRNSGLTSMFPIPSSKPAAGKSATGSISALPTLCKMPKNFLNIYILLVN
ncbi:hypothetical protein D3C81_1222270 [compost metagenome]